MLSFIPSTASNTQLGDLSTEADYPSPDVFNKAQLQTTLYHVGHDQQHVLGGHSWFNQPCKRQSKRILAAQGRPQSSLLLASWLLGAGGIQTTTKRDDDCGKEFATTTTKMMMGWLVRGSEETRTDNGSMDGIHIVPPQRCCVRSCRLTVRCHG